MPRSRLVPEYRNLYIFSVLATIIMRSAGTGSEDRDDKCPRCKRFIQDAEMVAFRVDAIQHKLWEVEKFLAENEWIFLENAGMMKTVRSLEDVDMDSFDLTCRQIIRFNRYIDIVSRIIKQIDNEGDNFSRDRENEQ